LRARLRWRLTPRRRRPLPRWSSQWKKAWWAAYQEGGEDAVRRYYREQYTLSDARVEEALTSGWLVEDAAFADWSAARLAGASAGDDHVGGVR
jgi:hypothetical protein